MHRNVISKTSEDQDANKWQMQALCMSEIDSRKRERAREREREGKQKTVA